MLIGLESRVLRTRTPSPQGAFRLQAKANRVKRTKAEIKVMVVRPSASKMDVLDKVYQILAASETKQ